MYENKRVGLIIYFFFQRVISLLLFRVIFFNLSNLVFLFLIAKLGLFPFFYWVVVVATKVGVFANLFILRLQKIILFWILWLVLQSSLLMIYFFVYLRLFFVLFNLLLITDLWILIVYSSIANTGIILVRVVGSHYVFLILLYLAVIFFIILLIHKLRSYEETVFLVFFFLVVPPFVLFFIKFYIIVSLDFILKIGFFLAIFDVLVSLYYFRLIFIKFILIELSIMIYMLNLLVLFSIIFIRNCVTMNIFDKS